MVTGASGQQFPVAANALDDETRAMLEAGMPAQPPVDDVSMSLNPMPFLQGAGEQLYGFGQDVASGIGSAFDAFSLQEPAMAATPVQVDAPLSPEIPGAPMANQPQSAINQDLAGMDGVPFDPVMPQTMAQTQMTPAGEQMAGGMIPEMPKINTGVTAEALQDFGQAKAQEAEVLSAGAQQKARAQAEAAQEIAGLEEYQSKLRERSQQEIQRMNENLQKLNSEIEGFEIESPGLLGKTAGDKVMASLALALGNIGAALTGQKSNVMDILKDNVNRAVARQKEELAKKQKSAERISNGLQKALDRFEDMPKAEAALKAVVYDKLDKRIEMIENMTQSQRVKANAQVARAELRSEMAKQQQTLEAASMRQYQNQLAQANRQREVIKSQPQNRLVAAGFAARMMDAEDVFKNLQERGFNRADISSGLGSLLPNVARSNESLMQDQAERNFVNAVLRQESGAAIAESEFESAVRQYFPRAGDTPEVIRQKEENRKTAIASLASAGGEQNLKEIAIARGLDPDYYTDRNVMKRKNQLLGARPAE